MAISFFFYDLETSGFSPKTARIMQFAGQRTDADLQPIGEPANLLIRLSPDVLPEPDAVMLTGITPQQTIAEGLTEAEFLTYFYQQVVQPDTIFVGFNSVRFDDEFMRYLHYRNFYDAYEWQWKDGCSRWDILDLVRMTRALRPDGINWPMTDEGRQTNRLELLTKLNGLDHDHAHDALSDVTATIAVTDLIKRKQPELYSYLLNGRSKKVVKQLVQRGQPFVYTSGRYSSDWLHTTVAVQLAAHTEQDAALVYDLRYDPAPFLDMSVDQLIEAWQYNKDPDKLRLPVKTLKYNRCPAVAPLGVIKDTASQQRLQLSLADVTKHLQILKANQQIFATKIAAAVKQMDSQRSKQIDSSGGAEEHLYEAFIGEADRQRQRQLRAAGPDQLSQFTNVFDDSRLRQLLPLYKAHNYAASLTSEEQTVWQSYLQEKLLAGDNSSRLAHYFNRLQELAAGPLTDQQQYLLEELQLYGQSLLPSE